MAIPPKLPDPAPRPDEGRHHRESTASVRLKAQRLRRALDADRLEDAIKKAADVAAELRSTSAAELSPKAYYDVYLSVCSELRLLEMYVMENARRGAPVLELYERVQETPLVLPRLYLLVTAGSVYVKSLQAPAKDVLRDLVEMCAGVQHPQRGLFLRAYLAQMMKDKLPDAGLGDGKVEDTGGGTVHDSIDFVIRNFTEMTRLWVRMQHDGTAKEMELREKERLELRLLVGSNIATLSRLVGASIQVYRDNVLPAVLEQIVTCQDPIAQEYLSDCVAQVFPDEFQLDTLDAFMTTCGKLVKGVNMRTILVSIIDRLARFVTASQEAKITARNAKAFSVFRAQLPAVVKRQGTSLILTDRLRIYVSLMQFTLAAEAEQVGYVDDVLGFCVKDMNEFLQMEPAKEGRMRQATGVKSLKSLNQEDEQLTLQVLTKPLDSFKSVGQVLKLENFVILQSFLSYNNRKSLAARLLLSTTGYAKCIFDEETLKKLFRYVEPLVQDRRLPTDELEDGLSNAYEKFDVARLTHHHEYIIASMPIGNDVSTQPTKEPARAQVKEEDESTFRTNQELVARIIYLCEDSDVAAALLLHKTLQTELLQGGDKRTPITLPSLIFASLRLVLRAGEEQKKEESQPGKSNSWETVESILTFVAETISFLPPTPSSVLPLRVRLHVAGTAASLGRPVSRFVYDNISAAFVVYEQHVTSSREQYSALELIIVKLREVRDVLEPESFDALTSRTIKHSSRALTRSDQCVLLLHCAQLFPAPDAEIQLESVNRSMDCVKRALQAAECCVNAAERVLLLLDVAQVCLGLQEGGVCDVCEDGLLNDVLKAIRLLLSGRRAKQSPLGKVAAGRYSRLVTVIRGRLFKFHGLEASEL